MEDEVQTFIDRMEDVTVRFRAMEADIRTSRCTIVNMQLAYIRKMHNLGKERDSDNPNWALLWDAITELTATGHLGVLIGASALDIVLDGKENPSGSDIIDAYKLYRSAGKL